MPLRKWACRHPLRPGGSVTLAACRRSVWMSPPDGICPSMSVRRSRCYAPRRSGCAISPAGSGVIRRRSLVSCAATRPPGAARRSTGLGWRSGRPSKRPSGRKPRSWRPTMTCVSMSRSGSTAASAAPMALPWRARRPGPGRGAQQAASAGQKLVDGVESGADRASPAGRLPR